MHRLPGSPRGPLATESQSQQGRAPTPPPRVTGRPPRVTESRVRACTCVREVDARSDGVPRVRVRLGDRWRDVVRCLHASAPVFFTLLPFSSGLFSTSSALPNRLSTGPRGSG